MLREGELPDDVDWSFILKVESSDDAYLVQSPVDERRFERRSPVRAESDASIAWKEIMNARLERSQNGIRPLQLGRFQPREHHLIRVARLTQDGLKLGSNGLMLNVVTPLQKFSKGGANVSDVIRQRFKDSFGGDEISAEVASKAEELFARKKIKMQQVCLLVEIFDERLNFVTSSLSEVITNSKSKECGPLKARSTSTIPCHIRPIYTILTQFLHNG